MNNSATETIVTEAPTAAMSKKDLADGFRTQSFHLMQAHPIAAAYLVLAAASIAPTCPAEQDVADKFAYAIADFAQQLGVLHCRVVTQREQKASGDAHGH